MVRWNLGLSYRFIPKNLYCVILVYPVVKRHDEFEFSGKVENIQMTGGNFGLVGALIFTAVSETMNKEYRLVIDHRTGEFVKLHRIKY